MFVEKINENRKFKIFGEKIEIFSIFIDFFNENFSEHFLISKICFDFCSPKIFDEKISTKKNLFTYSDSKFPKDSKNRTQKIIRALQTALPTQNNSSLFSLGFLRFPQVSLGFLSLGKTCFKSRDRLVCQSSAGWFSTKSQLPLLCT